jgi:hypothetical protein
VEGQSTAQFAEASAPEQSALWKVKSASKVRPVISPTPSKRPAYVNGKSVFPVQFTSVTWRVSIACSALRHCPSKKM